MTPGPMLLVTTPTVPGYTFVAVIGMVATPPLTDPETAMVALWGEASNLGANAVVGASLVFAATTYGQGLYASSGTQFVATGTAVIVAPLAEGESGMDTPIGRSGLALRRVGPHRLTHVRVVVREPLGQHGQSL